MKIAFLSHIDPNDVRYWSGTPHYVFKHLKEHHEVDWIGKGFLEGGYWHHRFLHQENKYYPEFYQKEMGVLLSEEINKGNYDGVISSTYYFCSYLEINVPLIYFSDVIYDVFKKYLGNNNPFYEKVVKETEYKCLHRADTVVYASEWARQAAISTYSLPPEKILVQEFGANLPIKDKGTVHLRQQICHLLFVGRNWTKKGGETVLAAYRLLVKEGFTCQLTIVGCIPPILEEEKSIKIIPWIDKSKREDLEYYISILQHSDFLILPTVFDAYGIVLCEAAAYGVPSIVANVGGTSQIVKDGLNGILMDTSATSEEYATTIRSIFTNKEYYNSLSLSAYQEYRHRLNWKIWTQSIGHILEKLSIQKKKSISQGSPPMVEYVLSTYVINMSNRTDRKVHIEKQFADKPEFDMSLVSALTHPRGTIGLWQSICKTIRIAQSRKDSIIIVCEDDHSFTKDYDKTLLLKQIVECSTQHTELLLGGIGGFGNAVKVAPNRFWIDWFYSTQFMVIFQPLFSKILDYQFQEDDTADGVLSHLTQDKQVIYPFISVQKSFGYSDVTKHNDKNPTLIERLFNKTEKRLEMLDIVQSYYEKP